MQWFDTVAGRHLLRDERRQITAALDDVFGNHLVVLGDWSPTATVCREARTRRVFSIGQMEYGNPSVCGRGDCLPVQSDSVDAVLAPHTLEATSDPHGILREIDRILRPEGAIVLTGFNTMGAWGLRHVLSRHRFPPGCRRLIPERRVVDWLTLLGYRIEPAQYFHYAPPYAFTRKRRVPQTQRKGPRLPEWRLLAGAWSLKARKQVVGMTPQKPAFRRRPRLVAGLVNPTTRNVA